MKKIPLVVALFSSVITLPVYAYQFEVEVGYTDSETDYDGNTFPDVDSDNVAVLGAYYFSDVKIDKGPLSVAAFMNRASSINALYSEGEIEIESITWTPPLFMGVSFPTLTIPGQDFDTESYLVGGKYIHASSGWLASVAYGESEVDTNPDSETDLFAISVGKYIAENTTLTLGYTELELDSGGFSTDVEEVGLSLFHVQELGQGRYYDLSLGITHIDPDDDENAQGYSASVTYYFSSHFGVGANIAYVDGDDSDTTSYGVSSEWFITDSFSVNASYAMSDADNDLGADFDVDTFSVGAKLRF